MEFVKDLEDRLLFAVPKKGRIYETCMDLLKGCDIHFNRSSRQDIALCTNLPIALVFLPAADIAKYVADGDVDLGITGQDIVKESGAEQKIREVQELEFGKCRLCLCVPQKGPYQTIESLVGKRIVTSFVNTAAKVFEPLDQASGKKTVIQHVSGSVEAACALGLADGIVDLVETGESMRAAGLHDIHDIMHTQSILIANKKSKHTDLIERIASRVRGVITAKKFVLCTYNIQRKNLDKAVKITPGRQGPTISTLEMKGDNEWLSVSSMILKKEKGDIMDQLTDCGATDIMVMGFASCRV
ncbi:HisG-domain-containing protein [Mycotypha africana]|uniref:HisG-domain-containing protein n=1 Tax=Mycotypha africana TaxID=64632 RepID=UPI002300D977|nr:HisG-domain-containing protein [Mycotypha africana]KAI8973829.1 HisG-domain-containing protein [Mycotypha africana]